MILGMLIPMTSVLLVSVLVAVLILAPSVPRSGSELNPASVPVTVFHAKQPAQQRLFDIAAPVHA